MTEEDQTAAEPERMVPPGTARRPPPTVHPRPPTEDEKEAANERTSPFPYAENMDEWVADETAEREERQRPRDARDARDPNE